MKLRIVCQCNSAAEESSHNITTNFMAVRPDAWSMLRKLSVGKDNDKVLEVVKQKFRKNVTL